LPRSLTASTCRRRLWKRNKIGVDEEGKNGREGREIIFETVSGVSRKGEDGCGNTDTPSGTVGRGGRCGEAGAGGG
jgi:hypothetical protein